MIDYLIEASICIAAFYACYWFNLSRLKLLNLNRGYLLVTLVLSLTVPLLDISLYQTEVSIAPEIPDYIGTTSSINPDQAIAGERINPVLIAYFIGLGVAGIAFMIRFTRVFKMLRKCPKQKTDRLWRVSVPESQSISSFFHYVFVPDGTDTALEETQAILKHEEKHAFDWHSLDLMFLEVLGIFLWFNPVIYFYRKAVKLQHEYIADEAVLSNYDKNSYTDLLARYSLKQSGFSLTHSFSEHPVEKRLKMIDNSKATKMKKLRSILIPLPLLAILLITISCTPRQTVVKLYTQKPNPEKTGTLDDKVDSLQTRAVIALPSVTIPASLKGKVQSSKLGSPLQEVSIKALPSGNTVTTGDDGLYNLSTVKGDTLLIFSKAGYNSQEIPRRNFSTLNVALAKKKN